MLQKEHQHHSHLPCISLLEITLESTLNLCEYEAQAKQDYYPQPTPWCPPKKPQQNGSKSLEKWTKENTKNCKEACKEITILGLR